LLHRVKDLDGGPDGALADRPCRLAARLPLGRLRACVFLARRPRVMGLAHSVEKIVLGPLSLLLSL
jgi:hypothetical protein